MFFPVYFASFFGDQREMIFLFLFSFFFCHQHRALGGSRGGGKKPRKERQEKCEIREGMNFFLSGIPKERELKKQNTHTQKKTHTDTPIGGERNRNKKPEENFFFGEGERDAEGDWLLLLKTLFFL